MKTLIQTTQFSRGFDRGNYVSAYETEDFEIARDKINGSTEFYRAGFTLGFFSSYEICEVPMSMQDDVAYYRVAFKDLIGE